MKKLLMLLVCILLLTGYSQNKENTEINTINYGVNEITENSETIENETLKENQNYETTGISIIDSANKNVKQVIDHQIIIKNKKSIYKKEYIEQKIKELIKYNVDDYSDIEYECKYSNTCLNVRLSPNKNGEKLGSLNRGEEVYIINTLSNSDWVKIKWNDTEGYCNGKYLVDTKEEIDQIDSIEHDGSINIIGDISNNLVNDVYFYYEKIAVNVRNRFKNDGWTVSITTENLANRFNYLSGVLALTNYENKEILIANKSSAKNAIVHEFGHFIDHVSGTVSISNEFNSIYTEELNNFISWHATHPNNYSTIMEYFAECYQECVCHPNDMQQYCPKTYDYIMSVANNL